MQERMKQSVVASRGLPGRGLSCYFKPATNYTVVRRLEVFQGCPTGGASVISRRKWAHSGRTSTEMCEPAFLISLGVGRFKTVSEGIGSVALTFEPLPRKGGSTTNFNCVHSVSNNIVAARGTLHFFRMFCRFYVRSIVLYFGLTLLHSLMASST